MKTLTQAWELIQLLSSLHFLSPTLVRTANPQTYTFCCSYNPNERYLDLDIHIDVCNERSCEYYIRIRKSKWGGEIGKVANYTAAGVGVLLSPITGGLSLLWSVPFGLASNTLIDSGMMQYLKAIENELKLEWENEQAGQNSTSETTSETSDSEVNSEIREEEEVAAEEPRPW
jgi:hypothetical protein